MREIDPRANQPADKEVGPRDYGAEVSAIVEIVQRDPEDASALERLAALADEWVVAEGLGTPDGSESRARVELARWLSSLVPEGRVVHFGWREGAVAAALTAAGAQVRSYLDHTGRAVAADVRHGSDRVSFSIWAEAASEEPLSADLVVVETAGSSRSPRWSRSADYSARTAGWRCSGSRR